MTKTEREDCKRLCYAIIYGGRGDDEKKRNDFFNSFPSIQPFIQAVIEQAKQYEYVETILGRRRVLSHINDDNFKIRSKGERQAINTVCQGSSSDIVKVIIYFFIFILIINLFIIFYSLL